VGPTGEDGHDEVGPDFPGDCLNSSFRKPKQDSKGWRADRSMMDHVSVSKTKRSSRGWVVERRNRIPLEISCGPVPREDGSEGDHGGEYVSQKDDLPATCLELLESGDYEDNRLGIERLVVLVNGELVNSTMEDSVSAALVFGGHDGDEIASRLRAVFPSFFSPEEDSRHDEECGKGDEGESSQHSDLTGSTRRLRMSMKPPALRVLLSSLELCSRVQNQTVDLSDGFWQPMLGYMTESLETGNMQGIVAAMVVRSLRLLRKIEPHGMEPYIKYALLPSILSVRERGKSSKDKMLVRECERLLKSL
jgi:hypothetical protein